LNKGVAPRIGKLALLFFPLLSPPQLPAQDAELLSGASLHLEAARYAPADAQFGWTGWIGAGAELFRYERVAVYFTADLETILGSERRAFDANQVSYHLEPGARVRLGDSDLTFCLHHVSRHLIDRPKTQPVDWNILLLRAAGPLPAGSPLPGRFTFSVGHTTEVSLVGYGWEVVASVRADIVRRLWGGAYTALLGRLVTTEDSPRFPRGNFVDFTAEGGVDLPRGGRRLDLFVAFQHRNDVFLLVPGSWNRALLGFRIGLSEGDAR
jgi:hypothetical protein